MLERPIYLGFVPVLSVSDIGEAEIVLFGPDRTLLHVLNQPPAREDPDMELKRNGSQPSAKGPAENFSGDVRIDPLFLSSGPATFSGAHVTFEPGARSA